MKQTIEHRGVTFASGTSEEVMDILCDYYLNKKRIRIFSGFQSDGKDWHSMYNIIGRVGMSTDKQRVPLLIPNKNSHEGSMIDTDCIVRITCDKKDIYLHPKYDSNLDIKLFGDIFKVATKDEGGVLFSAENIETAQSFANFLLGKTNNWRTKK